MKIKPVATISFSIKKSMPRRARADKLNFELNKARNQFIFDDHKPGTTAINTKSFFDTEAEEYELHFDFYTFPKNCWEFVMIPGVAHPVINIDKTKENADPGDKIKGLTFTEAFCHG